MHKTPVFLDVHLYIYLQGSCRWFFSQAAKSSSEWWFNEVKKPYALAKRFTGSSVVKRDELRWPVRHHKWCRQRHRHSTASGQHWWLWTWTSVRPGRPARRRSSPMAAKEKWEREIELGQKSWLQHCSFRSFCSYGKRNWCAARITSTSPSGGTVIIVIKAFLKVAVWWATAAIGRH